LWVWGRVLRSEKQEAAIQMTRYEFRTCGERSFDEAPARAAHWNMVG